MIDPIQIELEWLKRILIKRSELIGSNEDILNVLEKTEPPKHVSAESSYTKLLNKYNFDFTQRFVLILALTPHLYPKKMEIFAEPSKFMTGWGGKISNDNQYFFPTGETLMFILAGKSIYQRFNLLKLFDNDHVFYRDNLVYLEDVAPREAELSGILTPSKDLIDLVTLGKIRNPELSPEFPAKLMTTKMNWEDLVLSPSTLNQIKEIKSWLELTKQIGQKGKLGRRMSQGFKSLFYGSPGTGKTITAALLGEALERDVYCIDLSMVVSKYIGETEKNLAKVFDIAERKNWILFFDEADALFGQRTQISSSNDRYANQEVSYLLQRIESFNGLVILSSNFKENIDHAFLRRFNSIIHFPKPKDAERLKLWKMTIPENIKLADDVDLNHVAKKYNLTGAHIENVVFHALMKMHSEEQEILNMATIHASIAQELIKENLTI